MKFILYSITVMLVALIQTNDLHAMEKAGQLPFALSATEAAAKPSGLIASAAPAIVYHAQSPATTIDVDVTLITLFTFPINGGCGGGLEMRKGKPRRFKMNPDKTLDDHMEQLQEQFKAYFPLSFSKDGGNAKISLATKVMALGTTSIFAHKSQKLLRLPNPGEGEE